MEFIKLNLDYAKQFVKPEEFDEYLKIANEKNKQLEQKSGPGKEFLGWLDLPNRITKDQIRQLKTEAQRLREKSDVLVVIGIGGSYLGSKATIEALSDFLQKPNVIFAGFNLNEKYLYQLLFYLETVDFSVAVISKSGTTLEPAVAFRFIRQLAYKKYGKNAASRIIAITNPNKGALLNLAQLEGYTILPIPDDVGGRYSLLTPAGLLPIAYAGIDIEDLIDGATVMQIHTISANKNNLAEQYAAIRNLLYHKGFDIEILTTYSAQLEYLQRWWQQLFGESEGKEHKGLFPAIAQFTTDLHSLGQFIQQGTRNLFETVIFDDNMPNLLTVGKDEQNFDGLNYLAGKTVHQINQKAFEGTVEAHTQGGVPNIIIHLPKISAFTLGQLFYFFERACGISGYILGVNPFDQPGVEAYKRNMFRLLGRPGY